HGWRIIPVNPHSEVILGETVYRTLAEVPERVSLVDVFRPSGQTPDIALQAVAEGATPLWLELGIASAGVRANAEDAGLLYVEDRCLIIEQRRLNLEAPAARLCSAGTRSPGASSALTCPARFCSSPWARTARRCSPAGPRPASPTWSTIRWFRCCCRRSPGSETGMPGRC